MSEIDDWNLKNFEDKKKESFIRNFVIPEGLRIIRSKIKLRSQKLIPKFDPWDHFCDDSQDKKPSLEIKTTFHEKDQFKDYLLYVGVVNDPDDQWVAYASFCQKGGLNVNFIKKWN